MPFRSINSVLGIEEAKDNVPRPAEPAKNAKPTPKRKAATLPPMKLARAFLADCHTGDTGLRLRSQGGQFFRWDGRVYRRIPTAELETSVLRWLDEHRKTALPRQARDIVQCLRVPCQIPYDLDLPVTETADGFVPGGSLVAMANGLIDLGEAVAAKKGEPVTVREHTSKWVSEFALPYPYNNAAMCPKWLKTLHELFSGDAECIDLLGQWFGYCLTDDTTHHAILFLEGPPRTGKSTVLRMMQHLIGEQNTASPMLMNLASPFGLSGLLGKRLAICPDAHLGHGTAALAVLERLKGISGEDPVEVNQKYQPPISVRLKTRFALAVNELPKFGDGANALATRALILPMRNSFLGRENRNLEAELLREASGIFVWAIDGLRRLRASGRFTVPEVSAAILADFERLTSPIHAFIEDCCEIGDPAFAVSRSELFSEWRTWCEENGNAAGSRDRFGNALRSQIPGLTTTQPRVGVGRIRQYGGVKLK